MSDTPATAQPPAEAGPPRAPRFLLIWGVLLPLLALGAELGLHLLGDLFMDPIPTPIHALLIALVPLANGLLYRALGQEQLHHLQALNWLNGMALGVASYYALVFLPLTPFGLLAIVAFGIGFLVLSPVLSLIAAIRGRRLLKQRLAREERSLPLPVGGVLLALIALTLVDLSPGLTRVALQMTMAQSPATRQAGVDLLRRVGHEDTMLSQAYGYFTPFSGPLGLLASWFPGTEQVSQNQAQDIYYRVTGKTALEQTPPLHGPYNRYRDRSMEFQLRGGSAVGRAIPEVNLVGSRLEGSLDAQASTAYLEWTQVYRNDASTTHEARSKILLPPGAVVSRLTLWINGEEQEAAFGTRSATRGAYEKVVQARRDPVLVTTAGRDRIMVQLFPIPARGGEMKVRIGITVPLVMDNLRQARLQLPAFRERNFGMAEDFRHAVWLEANGPLTGTPLLRTEPAPSRTYALRGEIPDAELGRGPLVGLERDPAMSTVWGPLGAEEKEILLQHYQESPARAPRRLALVVDGSRFLAPHAQALSQALAALPATVELGLFIASDDNPPQGGHRTPQEAAQALASQHFTGGQDNSAALLAAWNWAAAAPEGEAATLLWVHGPQAQLLGSMEPLLQGLQQRRNRVQLLTLEAEPGPNRVQEALEPLAALRVLPVTGDLRQDLERQLAAWQPGAKEIRILRQPQAPGARRQGPRTSDHPTRLWAAGEIERLLDQPKPDQKAATALALSYRLVTPVSGAVVLEKAEDYDEAGLDRPDNARVPTIPEPEEWALMLAVLALLLWQFWRRRQAGSRSAPTALPA